MNTKVKPFCLSLLCVTVFAAVSYSQVFNFSDLRDVGTSEQVLDLTISLHRSWGELASDPSLRNEYEKVIGYWADGIYEATNGAHRLGKIRIFPDSKYKGKTDVNWIDSLHPNANLGSFMSSFGRINMSDIFSGYRIPNNRQVDWEGAGYTLAHESGHYVYSLRDEYNTTTGQSSKFPDGTVVPSMMNNQWDARGGNFEHLNFSTSNFNSLLATTNQWLTHGADAWTFLTDPTSIYYRKYDVLKNRMPSTSDIFTTKSGAAYPQMRVELPSTRARDSLQIIWMSDTVIIDMVLDRSGSMMGKPFQDLKSAAKGFVDVLNNFRDTSGLVIALGITTFSNNAEDILPITVLNNNVDSIKNIIDNIIIDNMTAMYDGLFMSAKKLIAAPTNTIRLCMLFTDGAENHSSRTENEVVAPLKANNIPINSFGYGSAAYHSYCESLSNKTNGKFYANLTDNIEIFTKWLEVFDDAADLQYTAEETFSAPAGLNFIIDPTVHSGVIEVLYTLQNANSHCNFTIADNNGAQISTTINTIPLGSTYPREEIALISINSNAIAGAKLGNWKCHVNYSGLVSTDLKAKVRIRGKSDGTYSATIDNYQNGFHTWPDTLLLAASITGKYGFITGLNLTAALTAPSGSVTNVVLNDSGINGDKIANDGIYSLNYLNYTENGQYTLSVRFDNSAGNAYYAIDGASYALPESGAIVPQDTVFVTDNFARVKSTVLHISGVDSTLPTRTGAIMGFENDSLWSIIYSSGTLSNNTVRTEGNASLQISGNGWQQIKSQDINTDELRNVTNKLAVDLFMGNTQTNPYWTGQVQLYINCPSANVYNQHIGSADLTALPLDMFSTLSFTLPQNIVNILNGSYSDFSFSLSINTNANTGAYYFDNMRFQN